MSNEKPSPLVIGAGARANFYFGCEPPDAIREASAAKSRMDAVAAIGAEVASGELPANVARAALYAGGYHSKIVELAVSGWSDEEAVDNETAVAEPTDQDIVSEVKGE